MIIPLPPPPGKRRLSPFALYLLANLVAIAIGGTLGLMGFQP